MNAKPVLLFAVVVALAFFGWKGARKFAGPTATRSVASSVKPGVVALPSGGPHRWHGSGEASSPPTPVNRPSIEAEVAYSTDLRAAYEKYRSVDDPKGEISYFLSKGIDECKPFIRKTVEQVSARMNARGQPIESPERTHLIRQFIDRCRGFDWDAVAIHQRFQELDRRAVAAGYPAAVARNLTTILSRQGIEQSDAVAMSLLSGNVDGDVIVGIYMYLVARNGREWFLEQGDPAAAFNAWALLECNMGADCGERNHWVITACLYYGACDVRDVPTALPAMYPGLDPQALQEAIAIETALGNAIRDRDWLRLGFSYVKRPGADS